MVNCAFSQLALDLLSTGAPTEQAPLGGGPLSHPDRHGQSKKVPALSAVTFDPSTQPCVTQPHAFPHVASLFTPVLHVVKMTANPGCITIT